MTPLKEARVHVGNALVPSVRIWPDAIEPDAVEEHKTYLIMIATALGSMPRGAVDRVTTCAMYRGAAVWELYLADYYRAAKDVAGEQVAAEISALSCAMLAGDWPLVRLILTVVGEVPEGRLREARDTIVSEATERQGAWMDAVTGMVGAVLASKGAPPSPETNARIMSVGAAHGAPAQVAWAMRQTIQTIQAGVTDAAFADRWRGLAALAEPLNVGLAEPILGNLPGLLGLLDHYRPGIGNHPHLYVAVDDVWMPRLGT